MINQELLKQLKEASNAFESKYNIYQGYIDRIRNSVTDLQQAVDVLPQIAFFMQFETAYRPISIAGILDLIERYPPKTQKSEDAHLTVLSRAMLNVSRIFIPTATKLIENINALPQSDSKNQSLLSIEQSVDAAYELARCIYQVIAPHHLIQLRDSSETITANIRTYLNNPSIVQDDKAAGLEGSVENIRTIKSRLVRWSDASVIPLHYSASDVRRLLDEITVAYNNATRPNPLGSNDQIRALDDALSVVEADPTISTAALRIQSQRGAIIERLNNATIALSRSQAPSEGR